MADPIVDLPVEALVEHWRRQAQKLTDVGIPLERVAESMRTAALQVETDWFVSLLAAAKERLAAMGEPERPAGSEATAPFERRA